MWAPSNDTHTIYSIHDIYSFITSAALQNYIHSHNFIKPLQQQVENIYAGPMGRLLSSQNYDSDSSQAIVAITSTV